MATSTSSAVTGGASISVLPQISTPSSTRFSSVSFITNRPSRFLHYASLKLAKDFDRLTSLTVRASSSEETAGSLEAGELFEDLKEKWDAIENKSAVAVYGGGALAALWLSSVVVGAVNSVPVLPKIMELVGLGYTGWFVYRYLLFKSGRKELAEEIEALKKQITGTD